MEYIKLKHKKKLKHNQDINTNIYYPCWYCKKYKNYRNFWKSLDNMFFDLNNTNITCCFKCKNILCYKKYLEGFKQRKDYLIIFKNYELNNVNNVNNVNNINNVRGHPAGATYGTKSRPYNVNNKLLDKYHFINNKTESETESVLDYSYISSSTIISPSSKSPPSKSPPSIPLYKIPKKYLHKTPYKLDNTPPLPL
tara:strand:- start:12402 stop:12989 length:588 start_codon:yes stop_codon:yes gene_type:complete